MISWLDGSVVVAHSIGHPDVQSSYPLDFYLCGHMNDITSSKSVKTICIAPSQYGDLYHTDVIPNELMRDARSIYSLPRCDGEQSEYLW